MPVFELDDIEKLAIGNGFTDVILAIPPDLLADLRDLRSRLSRLCAPTRLVLDVDKDLLPEQGLFHLGNLLMLDLQSSPAESVLYLLLKRAFDLAFSFLCSCSLFPFLC